MTVQAHDTQPATIPPVSFLWLEITGRCGLECTHCYAGSGPSGSHGTMTPSDWRSIIDQAADLGVTMVQFIGGEPTLHPAFAELLAHAVAAGLAAEVYTNLTHVKDSWWELFSCPKVSLATSWYSDSAAEHEDITRRRGSHARTRANITEAIRRGIPLRAGIIAVDDRQRVDQARAELDAIGVTRIGIDHLRQVGRGARSASADVSQLCGNCGRGVAAISPAGEVWPCVFSRWMITGSVRRQPLATILTSPAWTSAVGEIPGRPPDRPPCPPDNDGNDCRPAVLPSMCEPHACKPVRPCGPDASDGCGPSSCRPAK